MANFNEQIKAWYNEWQDNIRKEIEHIKMDNTAKVDEILALRNAIHENEKKLYEIGISLCKFANNVRNIAEELDNTRDYATYVVDKIDKIKNYNSDEDEDEEPFTHCDYCGEAIWDEDEAVCGYEGKYCCDECREEAEGEEDDEDEA